MIRTLIELAWSRQLVELYESGAGSQFLLHGNVKDTQIWSRDGRAMSGTLVDYLDAMVLAPFEVVLTYHLGDGLVVRRGREHMQKWPGFAEGIGLVLPPREAIGMITRYLRFVSQGKQSGKSQPSVGVCILNAELVVPDGRWGGSFDLAAVALQVRGWAEENEMREHAIATFLIAETMSDLHPVILGGGRVTALEVTLPAAAEIGVSLARYQERSPGVLDAWVGKWDVLAGQLTGATLVSLETLLRVRSHRSTALTSEDVRVLKKSIIERDVKDLIEFVESDRNLEDLYGQESVKSWFRQDIALWEQGDLAALPMGYLLCGPVGTGKTFMVECLAGEAGVPVVKFKNFRDRWVGSTEGNLEKIFRLLHALGRCIVFVDEADQTLGSRTENAGDSGVSSRVYSMIAQEMSDTRNRGKILWVLATSRPDLVEVDLKRPGRVDVKIPLFPASTTEEGWGLLCALCKRRGLSLNDSDKLILIDSVPNQLTPGTAESISVKAYRYHRTKKVSAREGLMEALRDYRPAIPLEVMQFQISLAVEEASDKRFLPESFRSL